MRLKPDPVPRCLSGEDALCALALAKGALGVARVGGKGGRAAWTLLAYVTRGFVFFFLLFSLGGGVI